MTTRTTVEVVSGLHDEPQATMGDFVPQTLAYLGKPPQSRLWAIGCLRSETSHRVNTSADAVTMRPRESFALAWLLLLHGLLAMRLQARAYLRALCRNKASLRRHRGQLEDLELAHKPSVSGGVATPNVEVSGGARLHRAASA